jgi:hypothetical protein
VFYIIILFLLAHLFTAFCAYSARASGGDGTHRSGFTEVVATPSARVHMAGELGGIAAFRCLRPTSPAPLVWSAVLGGAPRCTAAADLAVHNLPMGQVAELKFSRQRDKVDH